LESVTGVTGVSGVIGTVVRDRIVESLNRRQAVTP
jgi:hypothetical protein